ncbi:hypothetical protein [Synechococcus sp. PROS-U-1]|uniref:hypothetical protein n=1 Tax=Synechococcus sp. PROS-U-1 TaxID=1400866 RepID=UPI001648BDB8|nr:hypothetical protein [Synechococcus sp. PROS-U-1]
MKTKNHAEEEEFKTPPLAKIENELRTHSTWQMERAKLDDKQHQIIVFGIQKHNRHQIIDTKLITKSAA